MKKLSPEDISRINTLAPMDWQRNEQGIFTQPFGIPNDIKEPVIYCRYETGGVSGGSCWDSSNPEPYTVDPPKDKMKILELVLKELKPDITYLQFLGIQRLIKNNTERDWEYYGNCTNYEIEYIVLSDLYNFLENL